MEIMNSGNSSCQSLVYRSFQAIPRLVEYPNLPPSQPGKVSIKGLDKEMSKLFPRRSKREIVAGGVVKWKPVDKQAALLLSRSSEINKPPNNNMPLENTRVEEYGKVSKKQQAELEVRTNARLDKLITSKANAMPEEIEAYAKAMAAAKAALEIGTDLFRNDMIQFSEELPKHIEKLRTWRMTMERERDTSLKALRELRQFFLEDAHEKEMMRLNEFVRMAERLKALAEDGTLEKVADVMLKLS